MKTWPISCLSVYVHCSTSHTPRRVKIIIPKLFDPRHVPPQIHPVCADSGLIMKRQIFLIGHHKSESRCRINPPLRSPSQTNFPVHSLPHSLSLLCFSPHLLEFPFQHRLLLSFLHPHLTGFWLALFDRTIPPYKGLEVKRTRATCHRD